MKPKYRNGRMIAESELFDDDELLNVDSNDLIREDDEPQDKPEQEEAPGAMDEQTLRVECLKIAVKIAKLFDEVQPSDLIEISDQVFKYVQNQDMVSGEWDPTYGLGDEESASDEEELAEETPEDNEEIDDFNLDDLELPDEEAENPEENAEEEEKQEESGEAVPEDILDFTI